MNALFSQTGYVIKRQGLSILGKYQIFDLQNDKPIMFFEEKVKWFPPSTTVHVYADEKKQFEILTMKDSESENNEMDIFDGESGEKIGGIDTTVDNLSEFFKDAWAITDANDQPVAKVFESNTGQALLREVLDHELPQRLQINVGDTLVAELHQKVKMIGYELKVDFSMDIVHCIDRRLGIAAAIHTALHQGKEV